VTFQDETRRFDLVGASFADFKKSIVERFLMSTSDFSIQYRDEDDDLVTVSSDLELREAVDGMKTTVKFIVSIADKAAKLSSTIDQAKGDQRESDRDSDGGKSARKLSKKLSKKEHKESKKECLKRELLDELRKEFGSTHSTGAQPAQSDSHGPSVQAESLQIPSGEKLQSLLLAVVQSLGIPEAEVYNCLNGLTPEMVRTTLTQRAPLPMMLRMFLGQFGVQTSNTATNCGGYSGFSTASPTFAPPAFPGQWAGHRGPPRWGHGPHHHGFNGPPPHAHHASPPPYAPPHHFPGAPFPPATGGFGFRNAFGDLSPVEMIPSPPPAPLSFGSCGDDVTALQTVLIALGYLHCGPWHMAKKHFGRRTCEALCG
jgi:hypothetical protein